MYVSLLFVIRTAAPDAIAYDVSSSFVPHVWLRFGMLLGGIAEKGIGRSTLTKVRPVLARRAAATPSTHVRDEKERDE